MHTGVGLLGLLLGDDEALEILRAGLVGTMGDDGGVTLANKVDSNVLLQNETNVGWL